MEIGEREDPRRGGRESSKKVTEGCGEGTLHFRGLLGQVKGKKKEEKTKQSGFKAVKIGRRTF